MSFVDALPIAGTIVAAVLGALFGSWLRRSRPWAGIVSITRDDSDLVTIPAELVAIYLNRPVEYVQSNRMSLRRLRKLNEDSKSSADGARRVLDRFREARATLESNGIDADTKSRALRSILGDSSIFSNISYLCSSAQLSIPASLQIPDDSHSLIQTEDCTTDGSSEKAYIFYVGQGSRAVLRPGEGPVGQQMLVRVRNFGLVIEHQLQPFFSNLLNAVEREIAADLQRFVELRDRTAQLIQSRNLVVRVHVTNTGGAPEHLGAHALLQLRGGGRALPAVIATVRASRLHEPGTEDFQHVVDLVEGMATKQGIETPGERTTAKGVSQFVVVKPGDTVEVDLYTAALGDQEPIITALEQGMLGARVILERMGRRRQRWLRTEWMVLGETINKQKQQELEQLATQSG